MESIYLRRLLTTLTPDVTLHPKCNQVSSSHELPHLLIFPGWQALGFRLSKMWKFRDHVYPKMLEFIKCRAPLERVCCSQQLKDLLAKMKLLVIHAQKGNHTRPSYVYALPTHEDALGLCFRDFLTCEHAVLAPCYINQIDECTLYYHIKTLNWPTTHW